MAADGDGWNCTIERMGDGSFKGPAELGGQRAGYEKTKENPRRRSAGERKRRLNNAPDIWKLSDTTSSFG